jgi:hypothetical protein
MMKRTAMTAAAVAMLLFGETTVLAEDGVLVPGNQITLSTNLGGNAIKSKLIRTVYPEGDGFAHVLLCVYSDAVGPDVWTYDGTTFAAQDVFATRSTDEGLTWSTPVNISNTALLSSVDADHDGLPETPPIPYHGDSEKPNIFNVGSTIVVTWVDRYAPDGVQRSAIYPEFGLIEVPYACVYECRSIDGGQTWSEPRRLSDGYRDAKQDVNKGSSAGWVVTWQEDPQGLQPGQAEGPGDGGSGATVSKGTDIWWTSLATTPLRAGDPFPPAQRLTDNFTMMGQGTNEGYEYGQHGASRANLSLEGGKAIVAYEETKGLEGLDDGKYVRYHVFSAFDDSMPDPTAGAGWIVSKPDENARRVRFVNQGTPGPESGVKLFMFYKQGEYDQGGPSDIIGRVGIGGLLPENLVPPVAADPTTREAAFGNAPGINLSSSEGLDAGTDDNSFEDARAHRAIIDGDRRSVHRSCELQLLDSSILRRRHELGRAGQPVEHRRHDHQCQGAATRQDAELTRPGRTPQRRHLHRRLGHRGQWLRASRSAYGGVGHLRHPNLGSRGHLGRSGAARGRARQSVRVADPLHARRRHDPCRLAGAPR